MFSTRAVTAQVSRAGIRSYAVAAKATASTKPPVALFGVDGTYASALYTASAKTQSLESTDRALKSLRATLAKDPKLTSILGSPTLSASDKSTIIQEVMKTIGNDKTVKNFLELLADNNRLGLVGGVIEKFNTLMGAHRGEVEATIVSATQLDPKTLNRLQNAIAKSNHIGQGKTLKIINKVNPDILGGLIVEVGDRTIDLSISAKMAKLNKLLTDTL